VNKRFDAHRQRQALPSSSLEEEEGGGGGGGGGEVDDDETGSLHHHPPTSSHESMSSGVGASSYPSSSSSLNKDKSRKGSIDARILSLVDLINSTHDFFTTSTCSGRIILFTNEFVSKNDDIPLENVDETLGGGSIVGNKKKRIKKKGCTWLMVSHDEVTVPELLDAWRKCHEQLDPDSDICFKLEAAILHIQCRRLSDTKRFMRQQSPAFEIQGWSLEGRTIESRSQLEVPSALKSPSPPSHPQHQAKEAYP